MTAPRLLPLALAIATIPVGIFAAEDEQTREQAVFFENEVRPLLVEHCFECHGNGESEGGLQLDSAEGLLTGGDSGEAIVRGDADGSLLIQAVRYEGYEMPPSGKLDQHKIDILTRWVASGAHWPGVDPDTPLRKRELFDDEDRQWWAIQPLSQPTIPDVDSALADWPRNEIDRFVAAKLHAAGLTPAPEADRLSLVRRLYLDVVGLPPTPQQVDEFLSDASPTAYEDLVDRLLDSPGYGEHAARQWLDLVRYADSDGYRADEYRPNAWRYRDYVIRSFKDDKPYDRFLREQLAADELYPDEPAAQVALGYLRHWVYEWNLRDARGQWKTILEDVTDTTSDAFLGLGLQCAKCHNHKFDPLLQKDYFRLQAFFAPLLPQDVVAAGEGDQAVYRAKLAEWEAQTAELREKIAAIEGPYRDKYRDIAIDRFPDDLREIARKPADQKTPLDTQLSYLIQRQVQAEYDRLDNYISAADKEALLTLRRELAAQDAAKPQPLPIAMAVTDASAIAPPVALPKRPDEPIEPGIPSILDPEPVSAEPTAATTGRRAALARWLTDPANPLSTRVIVNRLWQSCFGRGLAANPSDLGTLGGPPTHPELLDWLAGELVRGDWKLKPLRRKILLSATYRQSTSHPQFVEHHKADPSNELRWRSDTARMTAEQIRDAMLVATGALERCDGGPGRLADSNVRTIYTRVMRNSPDQLLDGFDLPQFFSSNSTRNTTTTPVQALLMFNGDRTLGYARAMADAVEAEADDAAGQVAAAWRRAYGRSPSADELAGAVQFLESQEAAIAGGGAAADGSVPTDKLPYRDGRAAKFELGGESPQLSVPHSPELDMEEFTAEAFFQLRSVANTGAVRTIVSKWGGRGSPGWRFGVTGAGSRRKPQTLVLQMFGRGEAEKLTEAAVFSDQHVKINTPYYAAASYRPARDGQGGTVTFFLKDLSNDDEPLQTAVVEHDLPGGISNREPLRLGASGGEDSQGFDGLIDDVRLVARSLEVAEILYTVERDQRAAVGYWRFETQPGVLRNSVRDSLHLEGGGPKDVALSPREAALADLCHSLLNSNEFLYRR